MQSTKVDMVSYKLAGARFGTKDHIFLTGAIRLSDNIFDSNLFVLVSKLICVPAETFIGCISGLYVSSM